MKISSEQLLQDLTEMVQFHLNTLQSFKALDEQTLNMRKNSDSWSALECLEHLNRYGEFYLPEMEQQIRRAKPVPATIFKSGLLGNYFAEGMLPKEKLNKMKTFKSMNPIHSKLDRSVLDKFESQQKKMLDLLQLAKEVDLNKVKTAVYISKLIRLKLGDTFRVVIYHNERHLLQAKRAMVP